MLLGPLLLLFVIQFYIDLHSSIATWNETPEVQWSDTKLVDILFQMVP